ncbi:MAG TPA: DMT family protein [Verrucomicrobiae bacterium]
MNDLIQTRWFPIVLLVCSNVFMTFAWYGHLKHKNVPLWTAILASWGIAFFEYCLMVPANRYGHTNFSATQLKIIQEVITLVVFSGFAVAILGEKLKWNHIAAFLCILAAVAFTFLPDRFHEKRPLDTLNNVNPTEKTE